MKFALRTILAFSLFSGLALFAQDSTMQPANTAPDNTKVNQRDRDTNQPTADQQKSDKSDMELTRQIRRALVKDKSLSTDAHNVKVIAQNGIVTLRGPVKSEEEKMEIVNKAAEVAGGQGNIHNELQVKGDVGDKPSASQK